MTDSDINDLCPELLILYREWLMRCHAAGLAVKAIVTWRSGVDQNAAKASGASKAGAGASPHNCVDTNGKPASKAFDFACFDENARYITDGTDDRYATAGEIGEQVGLFWGARWTKEKDGCNPDYDHLQLKDWKKHA